MAAPTEASARPHHVAAVSRHCISRGRGPAPKGKKVTALTTNGRWCPVGGRGGAALRRGRRSAARGGGGRAGTARGARGTPAAGFGFHGPARTRGHRGEGHGEGRAGGWRCSGRAHAGPRGDAGRRCRTPRCPHRSSGTGEPLCLGGGSDRAWGRCCARFSPPRVLSSCCIEVGLDDLRGLFGPN